MTWSHYRNLLSIENDNEIEYYIELKVTKLNYIHTGQIQNYMNYIDKNVKYIDDNKTVGIIICKKNNQYVIDYCSDSRIISREYKLI